MSLISLFRSWFKLKSISDIVPPGTKLAFSKKDIISTNYNHGVEILNDNTTDIKFVVNIITNHFGLKESEAITATHICHNYGSVVLPLESDEEAKNIVEKINKEIRKGGQTLVCKLATVQHVTPADAKKRRG